jgi:hypothetical protein
MYVARCIDALKPEDVKLMEENIRALLKEDKPPEVTTTGTSFAN